MTDQRFIIEMGIGTDQYGQDRTNAACKAVAHAISSAALLLFANTGINREKARIKISLGTDDPSAIDTAKVAESLPFGTPEISVSQGGLTVTNPEDGNTIVIVNAAVEVFLPKQV